MGYLRLLPTLDADSPRFQQLPGPILFLPTPDLGLHLYDKMAGIFVHGPLG
ncbi:hypothetical [Yersinia pestis KIM10+]|uniref:Uncharacterized protein n=1 Tax=Yersinia pestis TaxID=632 RepID=Q8CLW2_YERPE|nr:hypothetical [Yersinia pestis KIM10+]